MNELFLAGLPIGAAVFGWAINKQLNVNRQVVELKKDVAGLVEDVPYIRSRVDAVYDHLVAGAGSRKGRGASE